MNPATESGGPRRVVIAGDGLAAWMTAAALARGLEARASRISVIATGCRDHGLGPFSTADATMPWPEGTPVRLNTGREEDRLAARNGGAFTLGVALHGWSKPDASHFHPHGTIGAALGPVAFQHLAWRLRREGVAVRLADYSMAALAAQAGRFQRPSNDTGSVLSTYGYGLHLDCQRWSQMMQSAAESAGVVSLAGKLDGVEYDDDGGIACLKTDGGESIEADLYVDCSGTAARLISGNRGSQWDDWTPWLPCNRVMSATVEETECPLPYSQCEAHPAGWLQRIPLQGATALNLIFRDNAMSDVQALDGLKSAAGGKLENVATTPSRFGRRRAFWIRNCVALGAAGALIDPILISNLQLLRHGINRLLLLLPGGSDGAEEAAEYNRQTSLELDSVRDYAILHYRLNGRKGQPFWDGCRHVKVPASLEYKVRLYESRGRVALFDGEPFDEIAWVNLLDANGVEPHRYHPIADGFEVDMLKHHVQRVRTVMIEALRRMPTHAEFLSRMAQRTQPIRKPTEGKIANP